MISRAEIEAYQVANDDVADNAAAEVVQKMRKMLGDFVVRFEAALNTGKLTDGRLSEGVTTRLLEQNALIQDLTLILEQAGYSDVVQDFKASLDRVGAESLRYFQEVFEAETTFSSINAGTVDALADNFISELDYQIDRKLIRPLESAIRTSFLTFDDSDEALKNIRKVITEDRILRRDGKEFTDINTEVLIADSQRRFQQHVAAIKAEELGLAWVIYAGPLDKVTSDQCKALLLENLHGAEGVYLKSDNISAVHPALGANPLITRGHPNCRHQWSYISEDMAREYGAAA